MIILFIEFPLESYRLLCSWFDTEIFCGTVSLYAKITDKLVSNEPRTFLAIKVQLKSLKMKKILSTSKNNIISKSNKLDLDDWNKILKLLRLKYKYFALYLLSRHTYNHNIIRLSHTYVFTDVYTIWFCIHEYITLKEQKVPRNTCDYFVFNIRTENLFNKKNSATTVTDVLLP